MKTDHNTNLSIRQDEEQSPPRINSVEIAGTPGIPQTDADLTRAFILKSHSEETRRTAVGGGITYIDDGFRLRLENTTYCGQCLAL